MAIVDADCTLLIYVFAMGKPVSQSVLSNCWMGKLMMMMMLID